MPKAIQQKSKKLRENWIQMDALACGTGWDEKDLSLPQILIEDVYGSSHPGSFHLNTLAEEASIAIFQEGGRPANFHGTDICDGWAMLHDGMNYILPSREVLCDLVEVHGRVIPWDGVVVVSSCDKSIPAHLMAVSRLNIPAVHIPGGSNRIGPNMSHSILVGETATRMRQGEDVSTEIRDYKLSGCPGFGACQFMGTASTMQCMSEALGMALPGSALSPASMFDIRRQAREAGRQIMSLAKKGIRPAQVLTRAAFENAVKVHAAISGSTNALIHLPAIAHETLSLILALLFFSEVLSITMTSTGGAGGEIRHGSKKPQSFHGTGMTRNYKQYLISTNCKISETGKIVDWTGGI